MLKRLTTAEDSEWFCRLTIQLFNLTGTIFPDPKDLMRFQKLQMSLVDILRECRDAQLEMASLIDSHTMEVEAGRVVDILNGNLQVLHDIEPKLNRLFKDFFTKARTALYHLLGQREAPESVTYSLLSRSLSFVQLKDDAKFEREAKGFLRDVPGEKAQDLIDVFRADRATWSSTLIGTRDRMIHGIDCPQLKMNYRVREGKVRAFFPTVNHQELRQYLNLFWENLFQAVEEIVVRCIAVRLPADIAPCWIPDDMVDPKLPFRWCFVLRPGRPDVKTV